MEASDTLLRGLTRRWLLILLVVITAVAAAYAFTESRPDEYRSTSRLLIGPPTNAPVDVLRASGLMAHTYGELMLAQSTLLVAAERHGLEPDVEELTGIVDVQVNENTRLITLRVEHEDPTVATDVAGTLTQRVVVASTQPPLTYNPTEPDSVLNPSSRIGMVTVIDGTTIAAQRIRQPALLLIILAAVVALAIAGTAAIALEAAPWRRPPANLAGLIHRRFLGRFPRLPSGVAAKLWQRGSHRAASREHRLVMTKIQHLTADRPLRSLSVFGARSDDGSSHVAADLAATFAATGRDVVVIDLTDERALSGRFRLKRRDREVVTVDGVVMELAKIDRDEGRLRVLVADAVRSTDRAPSARPLVELLGQVADLVVVAAPAVLLEFGTLLVATQTDGALLVGREDADSVAGAIEAFDLLENAGAPVLGTVLAAEHTGIDYPSVSGSGAATGPGTVPSGGGGDLDTASRGRTGRS